MLQFDEYKVKINNLKPDLEKLGQALDLESAERELDMLQAESAADGFWDNLAKAQKVQQRIKNLQDKVDGQKKRLGEWEDLLTLCEALDDIIADNAVCVVAGQSQMDGCGDRIASRRVL